MKASIKWPLCTIKLAIYFVFSYFYFYFLSFIAVFQEKLNPKENSISSNDDQTRESQKQVPDVHNGLDADVVDHTNEEFAEKNLEANLIDNEEGGADLESGVANEKNEEFTEKAVEANLIDNDDVGAALEPSPFNGTSENNELGEAQVPVEKETDLKKTGGKRKLQMQGKWRGVDPVLFFKDETIINSIKTFYGIKESFPFDGHLICRNSDRNHVKRIYYVSNSVKAALELNFRVGQQLKITSVGLKMFVSIFLYISSSPWMITCLAPS